MTAVSSQIHACLSWDVSTPYPETCHKSYPLCIWRSHPGKVISENQQNQQTARTAHTPAAPGQPPRDPGTCSSDLQPAPEIQATISISFQFPPPSSSTKSAFSFYHQAAASNQHQLPASTTRQQHKISISFQLPPPGRSTKPALASSFHHQAAAPHQSASSKASSQPAVDSTSLPHPHHDSQVCCCLDILWLFFFYCILVWAICTGIK